MQRIYTLIVSVHKFTDDANVTLFDVSEEQYEMC